MIALSPQSKHADARYCAHEAQHITCANATVCKQVHHTNCSMQHTLHVALRTSCTRTSRAQTLLVATTAYVIPASPAIVIYACFKHSTYLYVRQRPEPQSAIAASSSNHWSLLDGTEPAKCSSTRMCNPAYVTRHSSNRCCRCAGCGSHFSCSSVM
jgi:hypothetical protein